MITIPYVRELKRHNEMEDCIVRAGKPINMETKVAPDGSPFLAFYIFYFGSAIHFHFDYPPEVQIEHQPCGDGGSDGGGEGGG